VVVAQREVQDVARDRDALGLRVNVREQHPGIEEGGLVGVILEGDEVEPRRLAQAREGDHSLRPPVCRQGLPWQRRGSRVAHRS
jgi:hypothetical protein